MFHNRRFVLGLLVCSICVLPLAAQEPPKKPKAHVELRWVEAKRIEGLTEDKGYQASCDPKDLVYPHKKPAVVLTAATVAKVQLIKEQTPWSKPTDEIYSVKIHLTKEGRDKLVAAYEGQQMRLLVIVMDGKKCPGIQRCEKDRRKPFISDDVWVENIVPSAGHFSSKAEVERLVDGVK